MRKLFFFICLFFISNLLLCQLIEIKKYDNIDADDFFVDKLENLYFRKNNSILKTNNNFEKIALYDQKSFGSISYIDVSNPFTTLILFGDFNRLVFLDNHFSELRAPIILDDINLYNIDVACSSSQGGFWVYDSQNSQAILINKDLLKVQQGVNLYSIVENSKVRSIIESNNFIFLQFYTGHIIILDKFGNYYKIINTKDIRFFDVLNDNVYIITNTMLEIIDIQTFISKQVELPDIKIDGFRMSGNSIYILSGKTLRKFKIQ